MRKCLYVLFAVVCTLVCACVQKELPADIYFDVNPNSMYLKGEGDTRKINIQTNSSKRIIC